MNRRGKDGDGIEKSEQMMSDNRGLASTTGLQASSENFDIKVDKVSGQDDASDEQDEKRAELSTEQQVASDQGFSKDARPVKKIGPISLPEFVDKILKEEIATGITRETSKLTEILTSRLKESELGQLTGKMDSFDGEFVSGDSKKSVESSSMQNQKGSKSRLKKVDRKKINIKQLNKTIEATYESMNKTARDPPIMVEDSIIMKSLGRKNQTKPTGDLLSPFTKNIQVKSAKDVKEVIETTPDPDDDYLDYSLYADYYNNPMDDSDDDGENFLDVVEFRDYPMEDGYVRIPVFFPGLELKEVSEVPQLWDAKESFIRQVGSKLYMFIPSAILGFIIGLLVWVVCLLILRIFGVFKKAVIRVFKKEQSDELNLKVKYVTSGDPWIKISDAEKIHSVNGAIRKSVIGPCSPEKVAEFNQEVLQTINYLNTPEKGEAGELEDSFAGQGRKSWRVKGRLRRSSN